MKTQLKNTIPFFSIIVFPFLILFNGVLVNNTNNNNFAKAEEALFSASTTESILTNSNASVCIINMPDTTACPGFSLEIEAPPGNVAYEWNTGETTPTITIAGMPSGSQTYSVTVTCPDLTMGSDDFTITWIDEAPEIICADVTVELDDNCEAGPFSMITSLTDDCSFGLAPTFDPPGPFTTVGDYLVTAMVSDPEGNSNSCMATVTVVDDIPDATAPAIVSCPSDTFLLVSATNLPFTVGGITPVFSDGCGMVSFTDPSNNMYPYGDTIITVIGVDAADNESAPCTFTISIDTSMIINDTQDGSITIIPEEKCESFDGNLADSSPSFPQPPACSSGGGTRNDIWYFFTAPAQEFTVKVAASPTMRAGIDVYSAMDQTQEIACKAADAVGMVDSIVLTPGVTPGVIENQDYYVRVYDVDQTAGATTYFTIYIYVEDCPIPILIPQEGFHEATSEFTDVEGWTHYIEQDSLLLLSIRREGRNIGNVGVGDFNVAIQRDASVYDVSTAPYATAPNTQYLASGYYWDVTPNYAQDLAPGQDFSIRSYYTNQEYEAMRDSCPELGMDGHEELTHYKIDGANDPNPAPPASHATVDSDMIHFFDVGAPPGGYSFSAFGASNDYAIEMCIIDFSGGGFLKRALISGVTSPSSEWSELKVMPVPAHDYVQLSFTSDRSGEGFMMIYDLAGQISNQDPLYYSKGENKEVLNIASLSNGVYFLKMVDENGFSTSTRFVKVE